MKVLLATDSSECSQSALASMLNMKWPDDTEFKVVMVVGLFETLQNPDEIQDREIKLANEHVAEAVSLIKAAFGNAKISGDVLLGHADEMIVQAAKELKADLIMMGSHGRTGVARILLGGVSRKVLHAAPCAVRIVRRSAADNTAASHNVLVALDDSEHSAYALDHLLKSPWPEGTKFKCVSVIDHEYKYVFLDPMNITGLAMESTDVSNNVLTSLKVNVARIENVFGPDSVTFEVLDGDPREEILKAAEKWPASLIILGSHGRRLLERVMLGSVSDAVVSHAHCTVEVTRMPTKVAAK